jgi:magnesium chelatase family protein
VEAVRERQRQRFGGTGLMSNADMGPAEVREFCGVDEAGASLLRAAMKQLHMSARAYHERSWRSPHPQAGEDHR